MIENGKILTRLLYVVLAILLIVAVFFIVIWILNIANSPRTISDTGEHPNSPVSSNVPPAPEVIKIANTYFNGPFSIKKKSIDSTAVFPILCQKDGEYDIIYVGETEGGRQLSNHLEYGCWVSSCDVNNLYVAIFWAPIDKYSAQDRRALKTLIEQANNPACPIVEE